MHRPPLAVVLAVLGAVAAFGACHAASEHDAAGPTLATDAQSGGPDAAGGPVVAADAADAAEGGARPGPGCRGVLLPTTQHFVPAGMCASLVASGLGILRQISFAPNGDLLAANKEGSIKRLRDESGDGFFQPAEIVEVATTDGNTNNAHLDTASGYLYAGSPFGVQRWPYSAATGAGPREDVITDLPLGGHFHHAVHVYDGWLYVGSGSVDNCDNPKGAAYDDNRSLIKRFALAAFTPGTPLRWASGEVVTDGLRNPNGFARSLAGRIYAVVNGIDSMVYENQDVYEDNPGEQLVEIAKGRSYGFPFCFTAQRIVRSAGQLVPPGTQLYNQITGVHDDAWCATHSSPPATFFQAHSAPLDLTLFETQPAGGLPERYRGGAFVALHGSWNRTNSTGYKVVWVPFDAAGKAPMPTSTLTTTTFPYETVFGGGDATGPKDGTWTWSSGADGEKVRPAGVAISPLDGTLFVSSDESGNLYRVGRR